MSSTIRQRAPFAIVKPRRKVELAIDALEEDRRHAELPAHLIADDDAAHGGRGDEIDRTGRFCAHLRGEGRAQALGARRIHEHAGALQIARAVQARGQNEMTLEQRARAAKFLQDLVLRHLP